MPGISTTAEDKLAGSVQMQESEMLVKSSYRFAKEQHLKQTSGIARAESLAEQCEHDGQDVQRFGASQHQIDRKALTAGGKRRSYHRG